MGVFASSEATKVDKEESAFSSWAMNCFKRPSMASQARTASSRTTSALTSYTLRSFIFSSRKASLSEEMAAK